MIYVTTTVERLDLICWRRYGTLRGTVETVLADSANAMLRHLDLARLPPGTQIVMPLPTEAQLPPRIF